MPVPETDIVTHGEGRLDIDLQMLVSVLPWVREYQAQPMRLPIVVDGRPATYVPDGRLTGLSRPLCIEVKPLTKLLVSPDLEGRKTAIERALNRMGEDFEIWTEREIRAEPMFSNARWVWSNAQNVAAAETVAACSALRGLQFSTMGDVVSALGGNQLGWRVALALVGKKVLSVNLGRPIEASSPVRAGPRGWI